MSSEIRPSSSPEAPARSARRSSGTLLDNLDPKRVVVFSRDELKQYEVPQLFGDDPRLRWFIGDIRDRHRLMRAMHGVDYVVHAAALKQVDTAEYNPLEFVQTNVVGSQNVIEAASTPA